MWQGTFLPFGEELNAQPLVSDLKFTGKQRDSETGLDYFGARYNSSTQGRFMTPDWSAQAEPVPYAKLDNPQSLNLYSYVLNNPVSLTDADGHFSGPQSNGCPPGGCTVTVTGKAGTVSLLTEIQNGLFLALGVAWGHHLFPFWNKIGLGTDARAVAQSVRTGKLADPSANLYDALHRVSSKEIVEIEDEYLKEVGKTELKFLDRAQMKELAQRIMDSDKPGVKSFLERLETRNPGSVSILQDLIDKIESGVLLMPRAIPPGFQQVINPQASRFTM